MMYYNEMHENRLHELNIATAEGVYTFWETCAKLLGISLDEYIDFMHDMELMERMDYTLEELEGMYLEYCQEYDIPCLQIDIGVPMKLYGAI